MTEPNLERFERAYQAWKAEPVAVVNTSAPLRDVSNDVAHSQAEISPFLDAYYEQGEVIPPPFAGHQWYIAPAWTFGRAIRALRRLQQGGRHQVPTRTLLRQTELVQDAWRTYCAAIGI